MFEMTPRKTPAPFAAFPAGWEGPRVLGEAVDPDRSAWLVGTRPRRQGGAALLRASWIALLLLTLTQVTTAFVLVNPVALTILLHARRLIWLVSILIGWFIAVLLASIVLALWKPGLAVDLDNRTAHGARRTARGVWRQELAGVVLGLCPVAGRVCARSILASARGPGGAGGGLRDGGGDSDTRESYYVGRHHLFEIFKKMVGAAGSARPPSCCPG